MTVDEALRALRRSQRVVLRVALGLVLLAAALAPWSLSAAALSAMAAYVLMVLYGPAWNAIPGSKELAITAVCVPQLFTAVLLFFMGGPALKLTGCLLVCVAVHVATRPPSRTGLSIVIPSLRAEQEAIAWADAASGFLDSVIRHEPIVADSNDMRPTIKRVQAWARILHWGPNPTRPQTAVSERLNDCGRTICEKSALVTVHGGADDLAQLTRIEALRGDLVDLEAALMVYAAGAGRTAGQSSDRQDARER